MKKKTKKKKKKNDLGRDEMVLILSDSKRENWKSNEFETLLMKIFFPKVWQKKK